MVGKDRHLLQNPCKERVHASKRAVAAVEGPDLNERVMEIKT